MDNIHQDTQISATFHFYTDSGVIDDYGMPAKTTFHVDTTILISPIKHDDKWVGSSIDQSGDLRCIVHRLVHNGTDLIDSEWFSRTNIPNVRVVIGTRYYRVLDKRGHDQLRDKSPYHVLYLAQMKDVVVNP